MINIYTIREKADRILRKATRLFMLFKIKPNTLTLCSLFSAGISGFSFYKSGNNLYPFLPVAFLFLLLSALLDALDGPLAREMKVTSKKGDFLDHAIDRYADVLLIGGILLGGYGKYEIINILAISGVLLTSYFGAQSQALGFQREYRGILGRAYRLSILIVATLLNIFFTKEIGVLGIKFTLLGWTMVIFAIFGVITAIQRTIYIWNALSKIES